ncbi:MAG: tripartite tricarboxylate transporter substrate binding protein [Betaproteobacteria bacterium]|nr:tripartite tricarboxylate transporter substrate binding protein [Betaproteobacteria bacterium]MBI3935753.1 tripartite tricarboxylate transporter substrate binding protein [Betaproteobacteria bacterium]
MTRIFVRTFVLMAGLGFTTAGHAQDYPNRPIRFIVPFAPGGTSDLVGRLVGAKIGEALGETVVVDNRAGAGSTIGASLAAKAPADGHTILVSHVGLAINETLYSKLPYSALKDLVPVARVGVAPNAVVVPTASPIKTVKDLVAMAKKAPGKLDYSSGGVGSSGHLSVALLEYVAGVTFNHVPYKGGGPSMNATVAGQVHFAIPALPTAVPHVKAGRIRMLAVTGAKRSSAMPDVPTVAEAGVPGYDFDAWFGVFAPAGTPKAVISRLNQVIVKAIEMPELREQLARAGLDPESSTPDQLGKLLRADVAKWAKIIKAAGIPIH